MQQPTSTFLGIAAAVVLASNAAAGIINVGPGDSIQAAINGASDGDEVIVAPGTYFEAIDFIGKQITVRSADGPDATTIDGTGNFHVVQCVSGEGSDTILDGFTITGGNANGAAADNAGGGMLNSGSSPTVTNCVFSGNTAVVGGGMYNTGGSAPTVTNCTFSGNTALVGGGMANSGSSPTVTNCTFSGNMATTGSGGGMHNTSGSNPTVTNCSFSGNTATSDGGGMDNGNSSPMVTNCTQR